MSLANMLERLQRGTRPLLTPVIDAIVEHWRHHPQGRRTGVWHPSQMYGVCARREVIVRLLPEGTVEKQLPPPSLFRIFQIGHWLHRGYQEQYLGPAGIWMGRWRCSRCHHEVVGLMPRDACSECQWVVPQEYATGEMVGPDLTASKCAQECAGPDTRFRGRSHEKVAEHGGCITCASWGRWEYKEFSVSFDIEVTLPDGSVVIETVYGHIDGIALVGHSLGPGIGDIKTISPRGFPTADMKPKYRDQLMLYMGASKSLAERYPQLGLPPEGIRWARILYVNKSPERGQEAEKEVELIFDQAEFDALLQNPVRVREALAAGDLPERDPVCLSRRSKKAKGCPVVNACFESDTQEHVKLRTSP